MIKEWQNADNKVGRRVRGLHYTVVFPLNMPRIFHNKRLKNRQNLLSLTYQKPDESLFLPYFSLLGQVKLDWPHPVMSETSGVEAFSDHTHLATAHGWQAANRSSHCWTLIHRACHNLPTHRFLASRLLSDRQLEAPISKLCFNEYFRTCSWDGPLRKASAEVRKRIDPSLSLLGYPHSVLNTNPKAVDLLGVLDEDGASYLSLPFKNEVFFLGFKNVQCRNLGKWKSTKKNLTKLAHRTTHW